MAKRSIRTTCIITTGLIGIGMASQPVVAQERATERRSDIVPYLEVGQVLVAELNNGGEVLTYSTVAVGVDAGVTTRNSEAQVNLRYERRIGWGDNIGDNDILSGIARGRVDVVPGALSLEAGALGVRDRVDLRGPGFNNQVGGVDNVTQIYSVYAGPTLATNIGNLDVNGAYRLGYTKVESATAGLPQGAQPIDIFDDSVSQSLVGSIGQQPGDLPFGWAIGGGYSREDTSQLDQRFQDAFVRADVTVPVSQSVALLGGIGYEDVQVSERDAVRDAAGVPLVGADGRFVTDQASPRLLSFDTDGLIWDVGVLWSPSRRTSFEARYGRRYGSATYYGSFNYQPSSRTTINVAAFDTVAGFGSQLNNNLALVSTNFTSSRNPLSGDLNSCVFGAAGGQCFNDGLQSVASSIFRTRGIIGSVSSQVGSWTHGFAAGYNRRRFFASDQGVLAGFDGVIDEVYFANYLLSKQIDSRSNFDANFYANYIQSGIGLGSDALGVGANAAYLRNFTNRLTGTVALGIDSFNTFNSVDLDDPIIGSALVGLRYSF